ncbi:ELMO domain-containing protein B [Porphyridium purpureum]|uniref:ELMO domain-containing protein B n=1 Tax=Porphyridium purpureum TaxID=35688 RepID=A0A5J4Z2Z9_PORPP|nr:ELMO domain-containing protein B [Porphyridium purpureum]|eukprot:POR2759..scf208_2
MDAKVQHTWRRKVMKWILHGVTSRSEVERIARRYMLSLGEADDARLGAGGVVGETEPLLRMEREQADDTNSLADSAALHADASRKREVVNAQMEFVLSLRQSTQLQSVSELLGLIVKKRQLDSGAPAASSTAGENDLKFVSLDLESPEVRERVAQVERMICDTKNIRSRPELLRRLIVGALCVGHSSQQLARLQNLKFNAQCAAHEHMLQNVWDVLTDRRTRQGGRISAAWNEIGFQGKDPATDFRGGGVLALMQLYAFSTQHTLVAQRYLLEPAAEIARYPFACCSIALTGTLLDWLYMGYLDRLLLRHEPASHWAALCDLHARTWNMFHRRYLAAQPKTVMDFPPVYKQVMHELERSLKISGELPEDSLLAVPQHQQSAALRQSETLGSAVAPSSLHRRRAPSKP